jgi:hypothetical protein
MNPPSATPKNAHPVQNSEESKGWRNAMERRVSDAIFQFYADHSDKDRNGRSKKNGVGKIAQKTGFTASRLYSWQNDINRNPLRNLIIISREMADDSLVKSIATELGKCLMALPESEDESNPTPSSSIKPDPKTLTREYSTNVLVSFLLKIADLLMDPQREVATRAKGDRPRVTIPDAELAEILNKKFGDLKYAMGGYIRFLEQGRFSKATHQHFSD